MWVSSHRRGTGQIPQQPAGRGEWHHRPEHSRDKTGTGLEATDNIHCSLRHQNPGLSVLASQVSSTHSFWRSSRRWTASRKQSRVTLKSTVTGRSRTVARCGIKAFLHTSFRILLYSIYFILWDEKDTTLDVPPESVKQFVNVIDVIELIIIELNKQINIY